MEFVESVEFVEFIELKHSRKSGVGGRETKSPGSDLQSSGLFLW